VDVDASNLQIVAEKVVSAISSATKCIVPIHLYGWPAPVESLAAICNQLGIAMIEDCAQAHGPYFNTKHVGTIGDIGCFSFYPTKNLGAFGDAGMCVTNNPILAGRVREQVCYGFRNDRIAHSEGLNCRLDELQAAILRVRLRYLPTAILRRREIANLYQDMLSDTGLTLPPGRAGSSWHQYVIQVRERSRWIAWFQRHRIHVGIHYSYPIHWMPAYRGLANNVSLPITETACQQVISLPMYPELSDEAVTRVVKVMRFGLAAGLT